MRAGVLGILLVEFIQLMGQGKLVFDKTAHDFGRLHESKGIAEVVFSFVNVGDSAIQISDVKATCGCTTPYWSQDQVEPGDSGLVKVQYNVINRPGPFTKSVTVVTNGKPETQTLEISGHVTPNPKSIEKELPVRFGALRMKHHSLNMGKINTEKVVIKSFDIYNESDSIIHFDSTYWVEPEHIDVALIPSELTPRERGQLVVSFDPNLKNALGYQTEKLTLMRIDSSEALLDVSLNVTIEEFFLELTEDELALAPRLSVSDKILNKGSIAEGDTLLAEFVMKNEGNQDLLIRSTQPNCDCLTVEVEQNKIEPGEEAKLFISFNTSGRKGKQYKNVTIFSNDPRAPAQIVTIRADVKENVN